GPQRLQLLELAVVMRDDELAAALVRDAMLDAELVEQSSSFHAQPGLEGTRGVVHASVNDAAVVRAGIEPCARVALDDADGLASGGNRTRCRQAGHAAADDGDVNLFFSRHAGIPLTAIAVTS